MDNRYVSRMRGFSHIVAIVLMAAGALLAVYGLTGAFADLAQSAVQQTVLELRLLNGSVGLLLIGLGALILRIGPRPSAPAPRSDP